MRLRDLDAAAAERLSQLIDEALALPVPDRAAWLDAACRREPAIAAIAGELLSSLTTGDAGGVETAALVQGHLAAAARAMPALEGRSFGPWRVLGLLGRGGMGSVWLAERCDGKFERRVALKLVHPALFGGAFAERFAREGRILAALDHPNIARLLDAGVAEDGQPYLVLEYIDGPPLDRFADAARLPIAARVRLVLAAIDAVAHAHRQLVVHRDLKPTNILVESGGRVRLLDFGIAKLIDGSAGHDSELTQAGGRVLTPAYASPEQLAGRPIGTASDVYSLGVVLHELLCGRRPERDPRDPEREPAPPSRAPVDADMARLRSTTPERLRRSLRGDLDTIVLKALRWRPEERYLGADGLRQDLQRWLDGEAVQARPPSTRYRLARFVGRHRVAVATACSVLLLLAGATAVSLQQARRAETAARQARDDAARAQAVQRFLGDIFRANAETQPDPVKARLTTARELLDVGARRIDQDLKNHPAVQADVLDTLAGMYFELGLDDEAAALRLRRVDALTRAHGPNDARVADALLDYAADVGSTRERAQALPALAQARALLDAVGDRDSVLRGGLLIETARAQMLVDASAMRETADDAVRFFETHPDETNHLPTALRMAGRARYNLGDWAAADERFERALRLERARAKPSPSTLLTLLVERADVQLARADPRAAEAGLREALEAARRRNGETHVDTLQAKTRLGAMLHATGRRAEGRQLLADALAGMTANPGAATPNFAAYAQRNQAVALLEDGRLGEAEALLGPLIVSARDLYPGTLSLAGFLRASGNLDNARGRYDEAERSLAEALALWRRVGGRAAQPVSVNRLQLDLARLALARGAFDDALERLDAVAPAAEPLALDADGVAATLLRAQAERERGHAAAALELARRAATLVEASPLRRFVPNLEAAAAGQLGLALLADGDARAARPALERALALRQAEEDPASPWLAQARIALATDLLALGERPAAQRLAREAAAAALAAQGPLGEHLRRPLHELQERLRRR